MAPEGDLNLKERAAEPTEVRGDMYRVIDIRIDGMNLNNTTAIQAMEAEIAGVIISTKVNMSPGG